MDPAHRLECNYREGPVGAPGCICSRRYMIRQIAELQSMVRRGERCRERLTVQRDQLRKHNQRLQLSPLIADRDRYAEMLFRLIVRVTRECPKILDQRMLKWARDRWPEMPRDEREGYEEDFAFDQRAGTLSHWIEIITGNVPMPVLPDLTELLRATREGSDGR